MSSGPTARSGRHERPAATTDAALRNLRVVLVRPRGSMNIGAVARAMKNMGLHDLVLVRPAARGRFWQNAMAAHAAGIAAAAQRAPDLGTAVADCRLVIGTTAREGTPRAQAVPPEEIAPAALAEAAHGPVGLVFGPEDHGLSNADLMQCQRLIRIPADQEYPSLNLSQAVLLCAYALRRAHDAGHDRPAPAPRAAAGEIEAALVRLRAALLRIGFLNPQNPDHIMGSLRRILGRAGLEPRDVRILLGIARQIDWVAGRAGLVPPAEASVRTRTPSRDRPETGEASWPR